MLLVSLVPLIVAVGLVAVGVTNPGVQDCGAPAAFMVTGRDNERVALATMDVTPAQRALDAQPRCSARVQGRLRLAGAAGAVFVVLAATGVLLGLIDDRRRLRHEPPFESYLADEPIDAG